MTERHLTENPSRIGVEFTLTFLSFDLFDWNNAQNGRLLMTIGIISTLLQGGYVRRVKSAEMLLARRGVAACAIATFIMAVLPSVSSIGKQQAATSMLYLAAAFLAFTSATVVNNLNALASMQCDDVVEGSKSETHPDLAKGKALGKFRSAGQLGRAIGPILGKPFLMTSFQRTGALADANLPFTLSLRRVLDRWPHHDIHS